MASVGNNLPADVLKWSSEAVLEKLQLDQFDQSVIEAFQILSSNPVATSTQSQVLQVSQRQANNSKPVFDVVKMITSNDRGKEIYNDYLEREDHHTLFFNLVIEDTVIPCGNNSTQAFNTLFASFFVFQVHYPVLLKPLFKLFEEWVFKISKSLSATKAEFISLLESPKYSFQTD